MFSMDMTGEDVTKTGGTFLIERYPDPGAVWDRPWDPHTEWGRGNVQADSLKGDLINDAHLAVCERVGRKSQLGRPDQPVRGRQRSHRLRHGGNPVGAGLAFHRSLLPHQLRHA